MKWDEHTRETKLIRIYVADEPELIRLRTELTRQEGKQASFADVVHRGLCPLNPREREERCRRIAVQSSSSNS